MEKGSTTIDGGSGEFAMSYRQEIMDDQGVCLQVYSKVDGNDTEILRFDCFDQAPHYHYGPENHNIRLFMDKTTCGTPFGWTMDNLKNNLSTMVERLFLRLSMVQPNGVPQVVLSINRRMLWFSGP